jgi:S1-C subfamily serine protease
VPVSSLLRCYPAVPQDKAGIAVGEIIQSIHGMTVTSACETREAGGSAVQLAKGQDRP